MQRGAAGAIVERFLGQAVDVARWLAAGAPDADGPAREAEHAAPQHLVGALLDVAGVARLASCSERYVSRLAAEAHSRGQSRPLLLRRRGEPLVDADGHRFAVVQAPRSTSRGRPGKGQGWQFQRVVRVLVMPDWGADDLQGCGPDPQGQAGIPMAGLLADPAAVVTVADPRPGRWTSAGVTYYRDLAGAVWTTDMLAQSAAFGLAPEVRAEWREWELAQIRKAQQPWPPEQRRAPWTVERIEAELAAVEEQRSAAQRDQRDAYAAMLAGYREQLLRLRREALRRETAGG